MGQGEGVEAIKLNRTRRKKQSTFKQLQQERKLIEETGSSVGDFQVTKLEREKESGRVRNSYWNTSNERGIKGKESVVWLGQIETCNLLLVMRENNEMESVLISNLNNYCQQCIITGDYHFTDD